MRKMALGRNSPVMRMSTVEMSVMSSSISTSLPPTAVCLSGSVSNADMAIE